MSALRGHVALLVDFANLRQQIQASGSVAGSGMAGSDATVTDGAENSASSGDVAADGNPLIQGAAAGEQVGGEAGTAETIGRDTAAIARSLVRFAGTIGRVGVARAYADWSREPQLARSLNGTCLAPILVPATEDGEDRSHIRLVVDAMETLYNGDEPEAFIVVSSDPSLVPLMQAIRADGSEVVLVAADEDAADELCAEADQFASFEDVLAGCVGEPVEPRGFAERGTPARERSGGPSRSKGGPQNDGQRDRGYYSNRPLLTDSNFEAYDWDGFIRLIDELEQRLPFVGVRYLVNKVLGPHNCGIDDPHIKRDLINEAVDEGLIEMYSVGNVNDRTDPVTACRLDRHNPRIVQTLGPDMSEEDAEQGEAVEAELLPEERPGAYSATTQ